MVKYIAISVCIVLLMNCSTEKKETIMELKRIELNSFQENTFLLYDESNEINDRIKIFDKSVLSIYRKIVPKLPHHHDERTTASFLTYHNPNKYTFYKSSFYKNYCELLGIDVEGL